MSFKNHVPQAGITQQLNFLASRQNSGPLLAVPLRNARTMTVARVAAKTMDFCRVCGSGDGPAFQDSSHT